MTQPDCDFIDYCGDKAVGQVKIGSKIQNVCVYHAQELADDLGISEDEIEFDDTLEMFDGK